MAISKMYILRKVSDHRLQNCFRPPDALPVPKAAEFIPIILPQVSKILGILHPKIQAQRRIRILRAQRQIRMHADDVSINSFATAPTPTMIRSPLPTLILKIDVLHSNKAGTTFRSNSNAKTYEERVDREVHQLLLDIKRIQQEGEEYCAFGDLFHDELVEQVSCSALDTIYLDHQQTSVNRVFSCVWAPINALA